MLEQSTEEKTSLAKKRSPWLYLLLIPGMLLLDVPLMLGLMQLDTYLFTPKPGQVGFPIPIVSMMGLVGLVGLTVLAVVVAIFLAVRQYYKNKKLEMEADES